jgi:type II secretory pathway component PulC
VSFLVYSSVPERRSVALTFDGGTLTTLREGDEANGVAVVHINPDRVDLRYEGVVFTLEVRS